MRFDWTISLGSILTIVGFFFSLWWSLTRLWTRMDRRVSVFETVLAKHAETLLSHATKMERQDSLLIQLVGDVQRLIGRIEAQTLRGRYTNHEVK